MSQLDEKQLLKLKEQVEDAKSKVSELKGHKQALLKQLKDEWACNSTEEGDKKISSLLDEIKTLNEKIDKGTKELEEKYNVES